MENRTERSGAGARLVCMCVGTQNWDLQNISRLEVNRSKSDLREPLLEIRLEQHGLKQSVFFHASAGFEDVVS